MQPSSSVAASQNILVVANPIWDETLYVSEQFLQEHQLTKGLAHIQRKAERLQEIWEKAHGHGSNVLGRSGGSGANVMVALSKLGNKCSLLGRIGQDSCGKSTEEHVVNSGVQSLLIKSKKRSTGRALCFITQDSERTMLVHLGAAKELNPHDVRKENLQGFQHWHLEGYAFLYKGTVIKCLIAAESKATLSLNLPTQEVVEKHKDSIQQCVQFFSIIVGNVEELQTLTGCKDLQEAFAFFDSKQIIAATDGAKGSWVKGKGEKKAIHYDALKVEKEKVLNKTGAGDRWAGVFIALALKGKSMADCVELANLGAADWIQQTPGTYTDEKVWQTYLAKIAMMQ